MQLWLEEAALAAEQQQVDQAQHIQTDSTAPSTPNRKIGRRNRRGPVRSQIEEPIQEEFCALANTSTPRFGIP